MIKIKIAFSDFWRDFNSEDNWFFRFLSERFPVELSESPDYLIYSCGGHEHRNFSGIKIFFAGENVRPNFWECDYALGFDFLERSNYLRLPLYVIWDGLNPKDLIQPPSFPTTQILQDKPNFCCMVVSNGIAKERINFFQLLSQYKKVDSGGRYMNNIGGPVSDKMEFLSAYKFTIAFENSSYPGYVTEKIYQPMFTQTIPIYWGSPRIAEEFNPKSFINCHEFPSWEAVLDRIMEIDQNDALYLEMIREPWLPNNQLNQWMENERLFHFFSTIFFTKKRPVSTTWKKQIGTLERKRRSIISRFKKKLR